MKAISLWQPWATLLATGAKTIETRSWTTQHRGVIAIHAGLKVFDDPLFLAEPFSSLLNYVAPANLPHGAIVGLALLTDCKRTTWDRKGRRDGWIEQLSAIEYALGDFGPNRFGWFMSDAKPLARPIPCRGNRRDCAHHPVRGDGESGRDDAGDVSGDEVAPDFAGVRDVPAARGISEHLADIGHGKLDAVLVEGIRQKAKSRFLHRALASVGIGRLKIVGLLVFLRGGAACKGRNQRQC